MDKSREKTTATQTRYQIKIPIKRVISLHVKINLFCDLFLSLHLNGFLIMFNHYHPHPNIIEKPYNLYIYLHHLNKTSIMEAPHTQILNLGFDKSSTNIILHDCASLIRDIISLILPTV